MNSGYFLGDYFLWRYTVSRRDYIGNFSRRSEGLPERYRSRTSVMLYNSEARSGWFRSQFRYRESSQYVCFAGFFSRAWSGLPSRVAVSGHHASRRSCVRDTRPVIVCILLESQDSWIGRYFSRLCRIFSCGILLPSRWESQEDRGSRSEMRAK